MAEDAQSPDDRRAAELLRVNAELTAEMRDLVLGRRAEPRSAQMPAARRVAKLQAERDALAADLEASRGEASGLRQHSEELERQLKDQGRHIEELSREVARLRGGLAGVMRRARARLLRS